MKLPCSSDSLPPATSEGQFGFAAINRYRTAMHAGRHRGGNHARPELLDRADCASTLGALSALGVPIERDGAEVVIHGAGLHGLRQPLTALDAATPAPPSACCRDPGRAAFPLRHRRRRLALAAAHGAIMRPLAEMGARIVAHEGRFPPLEIHGGNLRAIDYTLPVRALRSRLAFFWQAFTRGPYRGERDGSHARSYRDRVAGIRGVHRHWGGSIAVDGGVPLKGLDLTVPGDLSSPPFFWWPRSWCPDRSSC